MNQLRPSDQVKKILKLRNNGIVLLSRSIAATPGTQVQVGANGVNDGGLEA